MLVVYNFYVQLGGPCKNVHGIWVAGCRNNDDVFVLCFHMLSHTLPTTANHLHLRGLETKSEKILGTSQNLPGIKGGGGQNLPGTEDGFWENIRERSKFTSYLGRVLGKY